MSSMPVGKLGHEAPVQDFLGRSNYRIGTPGVSWTYPIEFRPYYGKDALQPPD